MEIGEDPPARRRILFILPDMDSPPAKGYQVRARGIAAGLSDRYLARMVSTRSSATIESMRAETRRVGRARGFLARLVDGGPLQTALFDGSDVAERVIRLVEEWDPSAIIVTTERLPVTTAALCARRSVVVIDIVDSMQQHMNERAVRSAWPLRLLWTREARAFGRNAQRLKRCAALVIASSATARRDYPGAVVVPNAAASDPAARPEPTIDMVFTGNLAYWPNIRAVTALCETIAPKVRAALPGAKIVVAGRNPTSTVRRTCAAAGVLLEANVTDLSQLLRSSRLAVAPIEWTPSANLKIFEALAAGTPVLAYPAAIEQLPKDTEGVRVCDGADEMAAAAIRLLAGVGDLVVTRRDQHTWSARAAAIEALLDRMLTVPT